MALVNSDRAQYSVPPVAESLQQDQCSRSHSEHMAQIQGLAHDQFPQDVCIPRNLAAENIAYYPSIGGGLPAQLAAMERLYMSEQHDAAYCAIYSNHACTILNPRLRTVGVGIFVDGRGTAWETQDFTDQ